MGDSFVAWAGDEKGEASASSYTASTLTASLLPETTCGKTLRIVVHRAQVSPEWHLDDRLLESGIDFWKRPRGSSPKHSSMNLPLDGSTPNCVP
jgi:hypothetical protein